MIPQIVAKNLLSLDAAATDIGIKRDRLNEYVARDEVPYFAYCHSGPLFSRAELRAWAQANLLTHSHGKALSGGRPMRTEEDARHNNITPPPLIAGTKNLPWLGKLPGMCSGVYFLCRGDTVVKVGQSECILKRVMTLIRDANLLFDLDSVWYIECPVERLNDLEQRWILALLPEYNNEEFTKELDSGSVVV